MSRPRIATVEQLREWARMGASWYPDAAERMRAEWGADWELGAALFAAYSPRTLVSEHWVRARYTVAHRAVHPHSVAFSGHCGNVARALAGSPLSGEKVEAFRLALLGDHRAVVLDVHMLRLLGGPASPTPAQYRRLAATWRRACARAGVSARDAQAGAWIYQRGGRTD